MADLADTDDIEAAWRSLTTEEETRATYLIGRVSRRIRRRWPDVDDRLTAGTLAAADVVDVVVEMVLPVLAGPPVPGARSWAFSSGAESQTVTLGALADAAEFASWMVELFEGRSVAVRPVYSMPDAPSPAWPDAAR